MVDRNGEAGWVRLDGSVLSEAHAGRIAAQFEADDDLVGVAVEQPVRRRGRRVLKGTAGKRSPKVEFRVGEDVHERLLVQAQREGRSVSALGREATEEYVRAHQR